MAENAKKPVDVTVRVDQTKTCHVCGENLNLWFVDSLGNLVNPVVTTERLDPTSPGVHLMHECSNGCCS